MNENNHINGSKLCLDTSTKFIDWYKQLDKNDKALVINPKSNNVWIPIELFS